MQARQFWKMSGSGNDFVFFDATVEPAGELETPALIEALSERRTGVGADGVVFLEPHGRYAFSMRYFNRDGTLAEMCGNAALCSVRLARELGMVGEEEFIFQTSSGPATARFSAGLPEVDVVPPTDVQPAYDTPLAPGERRVGFARVGVPHLVVEVDDLELVDVVRRGGELRRLPSLRDGANVNFVAGRADGRWAMRTYERGVEAETLACGTGAVAATTLLSTWKLCDETAELVTRSKKLLRVRVSPLKSSAPPSIRGEGRIVYTGWLGDLALGT